MVRQITFFILLTFALTNCKTSVPDKVKGIPNNAFWVGGPDGGQWYLVDSINKVDKTIYCEIYNDWTGELVVAKKFKLHCYYPDSDIKWDNLQYEFDGYDGKYIFLTTLDADHKYCYFK